MTDEKFIVDEINRFRSSQKYRDMIAGCQYYEGKQDILKKKRTAIGEGGKLVEVENLPNNKIVDNQYQKMVDQKTNFIVGQPYVIQSENKQFIEAIRPYLLTKKAFRKIKNIAKDSLNCGISWMYPHYNSEGEMEFKFFHGYEMVPEWSDSDHEKLDEVIRHYDVQVYEGTELTTVIKVEVYTRAGVYYYTMKDDKLIPDEVPFQPYMSVIDEDGVARSAMWDKIPLIPFRYNPEEIPLISRCKSMQDGLNRIESMWQDQTEEDPRNTIMVLVNYDGENLGEFRQNLATYGAVKVRSADGANGDVRTLQIEVNSDNYKAIIQQFKKSIIENCMGYDAKDDRIGSNANEMNLKSMYSDIDLDANGMDTEYQAAFEELIWFINCHLANTNKGDFSAEDFTVEFNRSMMVNESDVINDCKNSIGLISDETAIAHHPWVDDVQAELKKLQKQKEEEINLYGDFGKGDDPGQNDDDGSGDDDE